MSKKAISFKEVFAPFFTEPSRENLRVILKEHLGEREELEFKETWPEDTKLAKHVLAMANSGGGAIIIGISEVDGKLVNTGVLEIKDKAEIDRALRNMLPQTLMDLIGIHDFIYESSDYGLITGKKFQVLLMGDDPGSIPFLAKREGEKLRNSIIYVRRMAASEEGTHDEIQSIINRRISTGHSNQPTIDLRKHLEDLRNLAVQLETYERQSLMGGLRAYIGMEKPWINIRGQMVTVENHAEFLHRMIYQKQKKIEKLIAQ